MNSTHEAKVACLNCGYDIRVTTAARCPECGRGFNQSLIPWEREIYGIWRFPMTVFTLLLQSGKLQSDLHRKHDVALSAKFKNHCIVLVNLIGVGYLILWHIAAGGIGKDFLLRNKYISLALGINSLYPDGPYLPHMWVFHELYLLLGMGLDGLLGLVISIGVFLAAVWDCSRIPHAALLRDLTPEQRETHGELIRSMGNYIAGLLVGVVLLLTLFAGVYSVFSRNGNQTLKTFLAIMGIGGFFTPFALGLTFNHIGRILRFIHPGKRLFLKNFGVVWMFSWRVIFWLILIPGFIGFIRLVLETLSWRS